MSKELLLRAIWENRAIGAAGIGARFASLVDRYGEPSAISDPQQYGMSEACKIWDYDELQVWCSATGVIDRVFYRTNESRRSCSNVNFISDMEKYRETLKDCDVSLLVECFGRDKATVKQVSVSTSLSVRLNNFELFATFIPRDSEGAHLLAMLRMNATSGGTGGTGGPV